MITTEQKKKMANFSKLEFLNSRKHFKEDWQKLPTGIIKEKANYFYVDINEIEKHKLSASFRRHILKHKVIKPGECLFLFGIPTIPIAGEISHEDFRNIKSDFIKKDDINPGKYKRRILEPVRDFITFLDKNGIDVKEDLSFEEMTPLFEQSYSVIFIFSHWINTGGHSIHDTKGKAGVEIKQEFIEAERLTEAFPKGFNKLLDFCISDPIELQPLLHRERPHCSVKCMPDHVLFSHWSFFYKIFFSVLKVKKCTYQNAIHETLKHYKRYIDRYSKGEKQDR